MLTGMVLAVALGGAARSDDRLEQTLRAKDQALLDAIAPGDRATWAAALAPGALYLDENNVTMSRKAFLDQLKPLPPNTSGQIKIVKYRMVRSGDVAIVVHEDAETEFYHGQTLRSTFVFSETWRNTPSGWRVMLLHTSYFLAEPPPIQLSSRELADYVGSYRAGPDLTYVIALRDGVLVGTREGRPPVPLAAELRDVFFVPGQLRTRKIFQRDAAGAVVGFVDRREGTDVAWRKTGG